MEETPNLRLTEFMDRLVQDGVDLQNQETVYAGKPGFDGESVKWLFARSALNDVIYPDNIPFCDIAEDVYTSDMLTGAMLRRVQLAGNS